MALSLKILQGVAMVSLRGYFQKKKKKKKPELELSNFFFYERVFLAYFLEGFWRVHIYPRKA